MDLKDIPDEIAAAIREFRVTYEENGDESVLRHIEVKFWDKQESLQMLAKHVGILKELTTNVNLVSINWHELYSAIGEMIKLDEDPVEKQIADAGRTEITEVVEHRG
jgi:hypothetical protein